MKFLKSQWLGILFGIAALALAIVNLVQGNELMAVAWALCYVVWILAAKDNYAEERIKALEKEVEEIKIRAITDIIETEPDQYTCMRKLGPDKNVKDFGGKK